MVGGAADEAVASFWFVVLNEAMVDAYHEHAYAHEEEGCEEEVKDGKMSSLFVGVADTLPDEGNEGNDAEGFEAGDTDYFPNTRCGSVADDFSVQSEEQEQRDA